MSNLYKKVIKEWKEIGGVLGYETERNGDTSLYVMDDGEFEDRWRGYKNKDVGKEEFARLLCRTALERVRYSKKEIEELLNW